jgi:tape measure domain-containing protein
MSEIDPVILELRADLGRYRAELKSTTSLVEGQLKRQENSAARLETQMRKSSSAIGSSLKSIGTGLATAFGAREIVGLIDGFTRLQNSLRVSGLEGQKLIDVQTILLGLSSKYGVSINDLAGLYGKSSQAAGDLGATSQQLLQITEASAQSLKITGTSAAAAQGALLGLTQALSSGRVKAEEFNQINEGGLRPLLQAAANTEAYGGSVAKLRAAVVDGKLSSQEFYQAILSGSAELEAKASKATLTLSGALEALTSNLTVYIGSAATANGVTGALAAGLGLLSDNLDTIIPALAIIATAIGGRLVAAALVGGTSLRALAAYASLATTSLAGTALAARGAGAALLGAFGGPVGLAITAVALGLVYVSNESSKAAAELGNLSSAADNAEAQANKLEERLRGAGLASENLANSTDVAAGGIDAVSRAAKQAQDRLKKLEDQAGITALKLTLLNITELQNAKRNVGKSAGEIFRRGFAQQGSGGFGAVNNQQVNEAFAKDDAAKTSEIERQIQAVKRQRDALVTGIKNGVNITSDQKVATGGDVVSSTQKAKKTPKEPNGPKGPTAKELADKVLQGEEQARQDVLRAQISLATDVNERADFEKEALSIERTQRNRELADTTGLSKADREVRQGLIDQLYGTESAYKNEEGIVTKGYAGLIAIQINREKNAALAQEAADLADVENRIALDALDAQYARAGSNKERLRLALEIIDLETKAKIALIDDQLAQSGISSAKKKRLELEIEGIKAAEINARSDATRGNQGAIGQYRNELDKLNFSDSADKFGVQAIQELNSGLADAVINGKSLGDVLENTGKRFLAQLLDVVFQLLVIKPLLDSLGGSGGSGGSGSSSGSGGIFGKIFSAVKAVVAAKSGSAKAVGGPVSAGTTYRVNESQQEFFRPNISGDIIPLSKLNAQTGGNNQSSSVSVIRLELSGDIQATMQDIATGVSIQVTRDAAGPIIDMAAAKASRDAGRQRL